MSLVLNVEILGEFKKLTQATQGASKQLNGISKTTQKISRTMSGALGAIGVGFSLNAVVQGVKSVVSAASDLGEATNAINVAFGKSSKEIVKFGEEAAQAIGLSKKELYSVATQFSSFAKTVGGEGGATQVIEDLATRGADFASVFNLDVSDALSKFQSGLAGQSEPLRQFGIDLSAAAVEAYAVENGIIKQGEAMTESQKVMARYGLLMQSTAMTQGDFANTSDGLANTQRILKAEFENVKAEVGEALLPVMVTLFQTIRDNLPEIKALIDTFIKLIPPIIETATQILNLKEALLPAIVAVTSLTTGLKLASVAVGLFSASSGGIVAAVAGIALISAAMVTVYNNTKSATSALQEFQRQAAIASITSQPTATSEQIAAETYEGILGNNPALNGKPAPKPVVPPVKPTAGIPTGKIVINNNTVVNTASTNATGVVSSLQAYQNQTGVTLGRLLK